MQELLRIRLPYALPFVFSGLRVAAALCVVGAVVAEFVGADTGLGYLIQTSMAFFRTPVAYGAVVILAIMGIVLFQMVEIIERLLVPWSSNLDNTANEET
jgi:NitT/TauT family transport system permease protein